MNQSRYKFTRHSLKGTYIRSWSLIENKWINVNLFECSNADFDRWVREKFERLSITLDESEYPNPTSERLRTWSIKERTDVCRFLYEGGALVTLVNFLERQFLKSWTCMICNRMRPDEAISVYQTDLSYEKGLKSGSILQNVRYCNDNLDCEVKAKTYRI